MAKKKQDSKFLRAKRGKIRRYGTAVFDLESKDGDTQQAGFTRPFLACFYDGQEHVLFRNAEALKGWSYKEHPHLEEGGVIDKLMRHIFGMDLCFDCEAKNEEALADGRPGLLFCPDCRKRRRRYSAARCKIFSHNGGRFDVLFIMPWLKRHRNRFRWEISGPESRIQRLEVWPRRSNKKRLSWVFQDSIAILPMSLEKVGKVFLEGQDLKKQHDLHMHEDDPEWDGYVKQDCTVLWKGVEKITTMVTALGGELGVTLPATAMNIFTRVFLDKPIHRNLHFEACPGTKWDADDEDEKPCHGCLQEFVREGYYGGRTELFKTHGHDVRYYDINSSYPASMLQRMPAGRAKMLGPVNDIEILRRMHRKHVGFVEADVWIPPENPVQYAGQQRIPPLPVRYEGKLVFPTGRLRGVWSWDELEQLFHPRIGGQILTTYRSVWYEAWPVFDGYVRTMYAYREAYKRGEGNEAMDALAKLLANALYGKTGMRIERGRLIYVPIDDEEERLRVMDIARPMDGDPDTAEIWEEPIIVNAPYVVPQLAAQVTTLSRILLFLGMMSVLDQGGEVLYGDTDSIMCTGATVQPEDKSKLGCWKREYPDVLLDGTYVLPKLYQLRKHELDCIDPGCPGCKGSIQKMKGVPMRMQTPENFTQLISGERVSFSRLTQHRTMIARGLDSPEVDETFKTVRTSYDKRILDRRTGGTTPLILEYTDHGYITRAA